MSRLVCVRFSDCANSRLPGLAGTCGITSGRGRINNGLRRRKCLRPRKRLALTSKRFLALWRSRAIRFARQSRRAKTRRLLSRTVSRYEDRKRQQHDFTRLDLELQQYFPFFNERRVIALRARTTLTDAKAGQTVPFYLQPRLGGPDTLRGYRPFRFADNNSLLMSAEYRYEVFSGLDMAIFADAGKVTARRGQINFKDLESSVGFGFRFNVRNNVFMRVETAFHHEGIQIVLRFNPVFGIGAKRTSSSQEF